MIGAKLRSERLKIQAKIVGSVLNKDFGPVEFNIRIGAWFSGRVGVV
jgi:hypothetical protein